MTLLFILLNERRQILMQSLTSGYAVPCPHKEVDESYGFDSPEIDNQWFYDNCGLHVFRRYICFDNQYCLSVFEPYAYSKPTGDYLWMEYDDIISLVNQDKHIVLSNVISNYIFSKNVPWVNPDGFRPYFDWVNTVAETQSFSIMGAIRQIKNAYVSSLFVIPTTLGDLYLKIPATTYVNDIVSTEYFWSKEVSNIPDFISISPDERAYLTKDMYGTDLQPENDADIYKYIVRQWGKKQQHFSLSDKRFKDKLLCLHDYTPKKILSSLDEFINQVDFLFEYIKKPLAKEVIPKLKSRVRDVEDQLDSLCSFKIPNTLCHGDMRPGNIRRIDGEFKLYDWGMSIYSHPFYDIAHFVHVIRRQLSDKEKGSVIQAYLTEWDSFESTENLIIAYALIDRLKDFFMTYQDCQWLMEILQVCNNNIVKYSMDDWLFSRRLHYFIRTFDRFIAT